MAVKPLSSSEILNLVGARHPATGFQYPPNGLEPYYDWLIASFHLLSQTSAGQLQVAEDDSNSTSVIISPGRLVVNGKVYLFAGSTIDLSAYNNDTALLWLDVNLGSLALGVGSMSLGWPSVAHVKLAEVTLSSGTIGSLLDRRLELSFLDAMTLPQYKLSIVTQGNTTSPSTLSIQLADGQGESISSVHYLRMRVCDMNAYSDATNATLSPGTNTSIVQTITSNKEIVVSSHTDGVALIQLTNATAETVTLRIGPAPLSAKRADYSLTLDVTHA